MRRGWGGIFGHPVIYIAQFASELQQEHQRTPAGVLPQSTCESEIIAQFCFFFGPPQSLLYPDQRCSGSGANPGNVQLFCDLLY